MLVLNTGTTPFIVDDNGTIVAGGERADVDRNSDRVQWGLESGRLLEVLSPASTQPAPTTAAPPSSEEQS